MSTMQNKKDLTDDVTQQAQAASQSEQSQMQSQQMVAEANAELLHSQAIANQSTAAKNIAGIRESQSLATEHLARAESETDQAVLSKIEAMGKLQELDLSNIMRFIEIVQALKQGSEQSQEQKAKQSASTTL